MTNPIPEGLGGRVIPYLMIKGASDAINFYKEAFGAEERFRMSMPDGSIAHGEIVMDDTVVYVADAPDDMDMFGAGNPGALGGTTVILHRYVADVDASFKQAVDAGCNGVRPPEDQFYGDRAASVVDPYGHMWSMHTHIRDVSEEEMNEAMKQMGG